MLVSTLKHSVSILDALIRFSSHQIWSDLLLKDLVLNTVEQAWVFINCFTCMTSCRLAVVGKQSVWTLHNFKSTPVKKYQHKHKHQPTSTLIWMNTKHERSTILRTREWQNQKPYSPLSLARRVQQSCLKAHLQSMSVNIWSVVAPNNLKLKTKMIEKLTSRESLRSSSIDTYANHKEFHVSKKLWYFVIDVFSLHLHAKRRIWVHIW